jgi:DNA invertase Pin-like site-specific DNA recombinase
MTFSINTAKSTPKTIAYLRVSTIDQDIEKNKAAILHLANSKLLGHVHFVEEKVSGKVSWRKRKIADILDTAQKGDNIIVSELSRLGRSIIERDLISKRTREALLVKKQNGMKLGRPKGIGKSKLDSVRIEIEALLKNGATQTFIAKRYNTTAANLHQWMKKHRIGKPGA